MDDSIDESDQECFVLSLTESSGSEDVTVSPSVPTICINDTDGELESHFVHTTYTHKIATHSFYSTKICSVL